MRPSFDSPLPLTSEGVGNAGCPLHPQPRVRKCSKHTSVVTTGPPEHPAFPHAMVLTASFVLSPVIGLVCHRHQRIRFCLRPVGPTCLRRLDAGVEASGPHDFAVRVSAVRQRAVDRSQAETRPAITSRAQRCRVHCIPPRVRDDRDTPLSGDETARVIEVIWSSGERKYFCKWDSTPPKSADGADPRTHGLRATWRPLITTEARMSATKCRDHRKSENPDVASLIRATLAAAAA